jgi:hypothetical protein
VRSFLEAVRRIDGMLVLEVQPGRDDFLSSVRHWEPYLRQPDVGVALDPEFAMSPGQVPGKHQGRTDGAAINRASAYVAGIVRGHRLPQKLFMIHQFHDSMIRDKAGIALRPGLAMTWNADGFGVRKAKLDDYRSYTRDRRFHPGLKLFYENDVDLMSPREVMKLKPVPRVINYQWPAGGARAGAWPAARPRRRRTRPRPRPAGPGPCRPCPGWRRPGRRSG